MNNSIALKTNLLDIVDEYDAKIAAIPAVIAAFEKAGEDLKKASCVAGTWGNAHLDTGHVYAETMKDSLKRSAWKNAYDRFHIARLASAKDKDLYERSMQNPPDFTVENVRATFGDYILDPYAAILKALAEAFCDLDPVFKSHEKMKIGVKGLPKRVIVRGFNGYSNYGKDTLENILNALAAYQNKPLVNYQEMRDLLEDGECMLKARKVNLFNHDEPTDVPAHGVRLVRYGNGNGHLYFEPDTLKDVNKALAQFYGEVLPDCSDDNPQSTYTSTEVSKDLQYYPTPLEVVDYVLDDIYLADDAVILEPSCGCGRFLDRIKQKNRKVTTLGIEINPERVRICREKGHTVMHKNFLALHPVEETDIVIMNPPFYGKHYVKHVEHALKFLKKGGILKAILPATARYDHKILDGEWRDLPVGSFKSSGTNVNTTILTIRKR